METIDKIAKCREQDYQRSWLVEFGRRTEGLEALSVGLCSSCSDCQSTFDVGELTLERMIEEDLSDEGGISRQGCDTCGDCQQQLLYAAHCWATIGDKKQLLHLEVCEDCVMFIANGQLPENWEG